jgi:hypothetical protein
MLGDNFYELFFILHGLCIVSWAKQKLYFSNKLKAHDLIIAKGSFAVLFNFDGSLIEKMKEQCFALF